MWMCSLCRLPMAKNHNFGQILTFLGLLYWPPFTDEGHIWCARADPRSTLTGQISSECVHCVGFQWPKPQFWAYFDIFGSSCTDRLLSMRAKFGVLEHTYGIRSPVKFRLDRFILSSSGGENPPIFVVFWTSAFSVVANWQQSDKVEHGCTLHNYKPSPTQRHQNRFCTLTPSWRNCAHKLWRSKA